MIDTPQVDNFAEMNCGDAKYSPDETTNFTYGKQRLWKSKSYDEDKIHW